MPSSLFGPMALSGFEHSWFLLFLLVPLGLTAVYVVMRREPPLRTLRFANMEVLQRVAPTQAKRWRQLPAVLLIASLVAVAIALAGPTDDVRVPRDRAIVMLVVDVSQSMRANDVRPSRLVAAQEAAKQFADELPPGIRLGFVAYAGTASMLVAPTTDRAVTKAAIDGLQLADRTATGESIFTALQTIATVGEVLGGARDETPARIVLMSDGKETVPADPNSPRGAYTAARTAKGQGVPISTVSFGTPGGTIPVDGRQQPVPVGDEMLERIAQISGGSAHTASSLQQLKHVFTTLQQHIGYESIKGDASAGWLRLGALALVLAAVAGMRMHTRLPD